MVGVILHEVVVVGEGAERNCAKPFIEEEGHYCHLSGQTVNKPLTPLEIKGHSEMKSPHGTPETNMLKSTIPRDFLKRVQK